MDLEDEICRIFSALDTNDQGFINKNDFLEKILQFLSDSNDSYSQNIIQIEKLMEPYSKIGLNQFKHIYLEIQRLNQVSDKENNHHHHFENDNKFTNRPDSPLSTGSSDIDDVQQTNNISVRRNKLDSINFDSVESMKSDGFLSSPGSAKKHGRKLLNDSKASFLKIINSPLLTNNDEHVENTFNLNYDMEAELESLRIENDNLKESILDLRHELNEENKRYINEKDQNKAACEKMFVLENMIHDTEQRYKNEIKNISEENKNKLQSMESTLSQTNYQFDAKCFELQHQISQISKENENLVYLNQRIDAENKELQGECRNLQLEKAKTEKILMEYKQVSDKQVTELQAERDHLEMTNLKLSTELQTIKHISPSKSPIRRSFTTEPSVTLRQRTKSVIESPIKTDDRRSGQLTIVECQNGKLRSDAKESESSRLVQILTMENRNLVERIAHLETVGFYQRQKLEAANCLSLAAEMEQLNVDELKKALMVERETVKNLQKYMETLTNKLLAAGYIDVFQLS